MIVIDGIADYVNSVNDEVASNALIGEFSKIAREFTYRDCPNHSYNPGSGISKLRGHLGSQIDRKCFTLLELIKSSGHNKIIATKLRKGDIDEFDSIRIVFNEELGYFVFH